MQSLGKKTLPGTEEDQMVPGDQAHKPRKASVEFHTHCSAQRVLSVGNGDKGADDSLKKLGDEIEKKERMITREGRGIETF